jgi:hypothetical protein
MTGTTQIDLFGIRQTATDEEILTLRKRELRNLLTSYADEADVFAEVIQNAFDAVCSAQANGLYESGSSPRMDIVIGRRSGDPHYILVCDNGIGMSPEVASKFTMPGFTHDKGLGRTVGYKGVGASFFFAASDRISFRTTDSDGTTTKATVKGSYRWIMSNHEPAPETEPEFTCPSSSASVLPSGRGTAVYYEFHDGLKPNSLSHIVRTDDNRILELRRWATYLCAKTAIGQLSDRSDLGLVVGLHSDDGENLHSVDYTLSDFDLDENTLGYPYPSRIFRVDTDIRTIDSEPESRRVWAHKGKHQAIRLRWSKDEMLALSPGLDLSEEEEELLSEHVSFLDVFFAYSTDVMDEIYERAGTRANVLRYGIRLACEGVPQGRIIDFDLTRHQGLARQAHAVIAFRDLELDTGRKIPAREVVNSLVRKVTVRAMSHLAEYRWAMKKKARPEPSPDIDGWINDTKERMSISVVRELFEALGVGAPIQVDPETEQDVIALFTALLSLNVLKGYELLALSGFNQYDGLVRIRTSGAELTDSTDPFSVRDLSAGVGGDYEVLEFKLQFESLLEDFEEGRKRPIDIDLLVCWTLPDINVQRGRIQYTYGERNDFRQSYGMTHL